MYHFPRFLQAARARGVRLGPKRKLVRQQVKHAREPRAKGKAPGAVAGISVSRAALYWALAG